MASVLIERVEVEKINGNNIGIILQSLIMFVKCLRWFFSFFFSYIERDIFSRVSMYEWCWKILWMEISEKLINFKFYIKKEKVRRIISISFKDI